MSDLYRAVLIESVNSTDHPADVLEVIFSAYNFEDAVGRAEDITDAIGELPWNIGSFYLDQVTEETP